MDNYEVVGLLGEGSFGRVYKAKQISNSRFVALKVISKRGRSVKELKGLRRECEIQRHLHHPNIIQMLDSFETENEIVVITEFAHKELNVILGKEGYLPEDRVQTIVWDLVSALYYLHSHRVLHRDLKPQNILLDTKNRAKLCDFGFARNMSTGTHVLTSIKGTPLYMAPELVEEQPYDHNADLWSLGCIIYELLVGAPPFCTSSILHLIRLIRHEQIQWPTFISDDCVSFLKGLLQKKPANRMTWPEILDHPFVKGHILIADNNTPSMPLTRPMSANTLQVKEQQRMEKCSTSKGLTPTVEAKNALHESKKAEETTNKIERNPKTDKSKAADDQNRSSGLLNFNEDNYPIENEEWIVFLQKTIEEVMGGEMTSLSQPNLTNIIVSPLRNRNCSSKVVALAASLLSLPFVVNGVSEECLEKIKKTYLEVKLIPNLVNASKLLMKQKNTTDSTDSSSSNSPLNSTNPQIYRSINDLSDQDLQALEYTYLLICHLVHLDIEYLIKFCEAVVVLNIYELLQKLFLLSNKKLRVVIDLMAILTLVLRKLPENSDIISRIMQNEREEGEDQVHFANFLRHSNTLLKQTVCYFLAFMGKNASKTLESIWDLKMREMLEALVYDSNEGVRNAAETAVEEIKKMKFY